MEGGNRGEEWKERREERERDTHTHTERETQTERLTTRSSDIQLFFNYMDYQPDYCSWCFTREQARWMRRAARRYYPRMIAAATEAELRGAEAVRPKEDKEWTPETR